MAQIRCPFYLLFYPWIKKKLGKGYIEQAFLINETRAIGGGLSSCRRIELSGRIQLNGGGLRSVGGFTALHAKGTGFDSPCPLHPWDVWQSPVTLLPYYIMGDKDMEYLEEFTVSLLYKWDQTHTSSWGFVIQLGMWYHLYDTDSQSIIA